MKKAVATLACVLIPFAAHAFEVKGEPDSLFEELRTGAITITDTTLTSEKGVAELKKIKEVKREFTGTHIDFAVIKDSILLCHGGTPASHLTVWGIDDSEGSSNFRLIVYGEVKNDAGDIFVEGCGGHSYNIGAKVK